MAKIRAERADALALLFYFISFAGWCGETLLFLLRFGRFEDRGFLTLPLCTIYGGCMLAVYLLLGTPRRGRFGPLFRRADGLAAPARAAARAGLYALYALAAALPPTVAELAFGGLFRLFGVRLWDYGYKRVHLFGLISPDQSLLWGMLIALAMRFLWDPLLALAQRVPPRAGRAAALALTALTAADFACNLLSLLYTGRRLLPALLTGSF